MDAFNALKERLERPSRPQNLLRFTPLSRDVQLYLSQVYRILALCLLLCAAGVFLNSLAPWTTALGAIGSLVATPWLLLTPSRADTRPRRQNLMGAVALSQGLVLGPIVNASLAVAPGVVLAAALATATIFACFSAAALMSPRRQYLYLGGVLAAVSLGLLVTQLVGMLFRGSILSYTGHLLVGIVMFSGWVVYDTQLIVERADAGLRDDLRDALELFIDAVAIFVRVLALLTKREDEKEERTEGKRARRRGGRM